MNCYKCATPLPDHSKFCMACGADVSGEGHMHDATISTDADPELMAALQVELGSDYTVERELGRGGMAIVYLGKDNHLGRKVAIKLLPPMLTFGSGPGFIERFKREARTSATLDHPHIIPIYRVSTGGKLFWYVMKFLQGESLDEVLKRDGAIDIDKTVDIISQAGDALDYAHSNDVVHRDIKPANMMLDKRGWVTVTDFGIAKALNTGTLTGSGAAIGTPHYMAPEQCVGVGVTGASDQYALAVSAYQMLSGELPFKADSILELMRMHSADPPPPLAERRSGLPPGLAAAVERALAKAPADRFASCGDFARELVRWTKDAEVAARRPTAAAVVKQTVEEAPRLKPVMKQRTDTPVAPMPPSRRRLVIGAVAIATVLVGGFAVYKMTRPDAVPQSQLASGAQTTPTPPKVDSPNAAQVSNPPPTGADSTKGALPPPGGASKGANAPVAATARLEMIGLPRGAAVTRNGQRVPGVTDQDVNQFLFHVPVGRATVFVVTAPGYDAWRRSITPKDTQPLTAAVVMRAVQSAANKQKAAGPNKAPAPDATPAVTGTAKITVGSRTPASILVNGKPVPDNPLRDFDVPAGRVVITFQVTDSTGVWTMDTVVTLAAGERRNLGRIALRHP